MIFIQIIFTINAHKKFLNPITTQEPYAI